MDEPVKSRKLKLGKLIFLLSVFSSQLCLGQTHTMSGTNNVPSGASLILQSGSTTDFNSGATVDFTGATVTGLSGGVAWGGITGTLSAQTDLNTALSGKQATDADLDAWALKTPYAGTVTVTTGKTFNATGTLTYAGTDGSTLNIGGGGTLGTAAYTASTAYQTADSDLTTWAGVTPTSGIQTWLATPSSANLRGAVTDENGTGALLFSGATTPDFTTGFTVGTAAAAGKILIGNGTNYVVSTPTWPTTATGITGYEIMSNGTNFVAYPTTLVNSSVSSQSPSTSEVYVTGSNVVVAAGDFKAKGQYRCVFDIVKSAGTGIPVVAVKIGTLGTTSDTTQLTFTFPGAGTSVADTGTIEVIANWRTVGSGSSAVVSGQCRAQKNTITAAGLWGTTSASLTIVSAVSGGFNSSAATTIGTTFNGGTAFAGTITTVQATLNQP